MNRLNLIRLQIYVTKGIAIVVMMLAIVAIVSGSINTFQFFNNNKQQQRTK
jgi:hypothetical protein